MYEMETEAINNQYNKGHSGSTLYRYSRRASHPPDDPILSLRGSDTDYVFTATALVSIVQLYLYVMPQRYARRLSTIN